MGKVVTVGGITAVAFTVVGLMAPVVFPEIPRIFAILLLVMAAASLVATFIWWVLERPKYTHRSINVAMNSRTRKRQIIDDCRKLIVDWGFDHGHREQRNYLEGNLSFLAVKKHLSANFMSVYDKNHTAIITPLETNPRPYLMRRLASELDRLETEWKLDG